tara:strand:+ start:4156 stop:5274 length:1119 start_codon:yes stop_codon:yes gene_type:complete
LKVALVHDWLTGIRGGEKCLEVLCEIYPDAHLYTLICDKNILSPSLKRMDIRTSNLRFFPFVGKYYRYLLPIMPAAIERFELKGYDLVISSSHCVAKGIRTEKNTYHICYCFTPMRYIWDQSSQYFNKTTAGPLTRFIFKLLKKYLQNWDRKSAGKVDHFVAISHHVSNRIKKFYNRGSVVIYPPVSTNFFELSNSVDDYYLVVSAFAPYKRIDLAIKAFNRLRYPLKIIGSGQCEKQLREIAGPNIEFLGSLNDEEIKHYYSKCKAFIFPGEEDFGITPLEAMASGRPVIAFGKGGALETVIPFTNENNSPTGLFFKEQTSDSLVEAVQQFEKIEHKFDSKKIREHTLKFDREVFEKKIREFIDKKMDSRL